MDIKRRKFLRLAGRGLAAAGLEPGRMLSLKGGMPRSDAPASPLWPQLADDEYPFPYDSSVFLSAERIFNLRPERGFAFKWRADLHLLLRPDATPAIKGYRSEPTE